jgi:hypothetical protein
MAKTVGAAAEYVSNEAARYTRRMWRISLCFMAFLGVVEGFSLSRLVARFTLPLWLSASTFALAFLASILLWKWVDRKLITLDKDRAAYRSGALGENAVASALRDLPANFWVIHDVPAPFGNLDHVVIGPTGIFVIETKNWRGVVSADGTGELLLNTLPLDKPYIRQFVSRMLDVRDKIRRLANNLDPFYQAVFVFTSARVEAKWGKTRNVHCLHDNQLFDYIVKRKCDTKLSVPDAERIAQAFASLRCADTEFVRVRQAPSRPATHPLIKPAVSSCP